MSSLSNALLRPSNRLSSRAISALGQLVDHKVLFSITATHNALKVRLISLSHVRFHAPMVLLNNILLCSVTHHHVVRDYRLSPTAIKTVLRTFGRLKHDPRLCQQQNRRIRVCCASLDRGRRQFIRHASHHNGACSHCCRRIDRLHDDPTVFFDYRNAQRRRRTLITQLSSVINVHIIVCPSTCSQSG